MDGDGRDPYRTAAAYSGRVSATEAESPPAGLEVRRTSGEWCEWELSPGMRARPGGRRWSTVEWGNGEFAAIHHDGSVAYAASVGGQVDLDHTSEPDPLPWTPSLR